MSVPYTNLKESCSNVKQQILSKWVCSSDIARLPNNSTADEQHETWNTNSYYP
jgi:hypothetical protein